jgi:hypothetical protein
VSDLEAIEWASLEDAYGSAERVPDLLRRAESAGSEFGDEWDALWSHLCHQGTVYTASYAAIPALAAMCLRREPSGYVAPLQLIGSILASHDAPADADQLRKRYAAETVTLRTFAERCVGRTADDAELAYALETLMAFEGGGVWSRSLNHLADGEIPRECDGCGAYLLVHLEDLPATVTAWESSSASTTVVPAERLADDEQRLGRPRLRVTRTRVRLLAPDGRRRGQLLGHV